MFDKPTRTAIKINTNNFGDGLAGRGLGLNNTIAELRPLVTNAMPVLHNLAAPATGLRELFVALDRAASQTAPGGRARTRTTSSTSTNSSPTGRAVAPSIEAATTGGPPSLEQAIHSLPARGAVLRERHRIHAPAAPERRVADAPSRRNSDTRSAKAPINLAAATRAEHAARRILQGARRNSRTTRSSRSASKTSRTRSKSATRCSPGSRPSRPSATTGRSRSATSRASSPRTSASARSRAPASCSRRPAPTTRATPPRRPPTDRRPNTPSTGSTVIIDNNHLHVQPLPERRPAPASRWCAKRATRTTSPGRR